MVTTTLRKGQPIRFEYTKANEHTHREGIVEKFNAEKGYVVVRTDTFPLTYKTFRLEKMHGLQTY